MKEPLKSFFVTRGTHTHENESKTKTQLVAHGEYSRITNFRTKFPRYLEEYLQFLPHMKSLFIDSTISREILNDVLRNPDWETLQQTHEMQC